MYPAERAALQASVETYLREAEIAPIPGRLLSVVVPHAGYVYSGAVAAYAYRALQTQGCTGATLVVIGDTHSGLGSAEIAVWASGAFETPLGMIAVDEEVAHSLLDADPHIQFDREAFRGEHPVENQVPFIQSACPQARIVPIVVRQPSLQNAHLLAEALVTAFADGPDGSRLIVASTDLSHYYPYHVAQQIDEVALQAIASLDVQAVIDSPRRCTELAIADNPGAMCSPGAVMTALLASQRMGADQATVLHYANSGDVPIGRRTEVVGYGAVALWDSNEQQIPAEFQLPFAPEEPLEPQPLSPEAREELLALARRTAHQYLTTQSFPAYHPEDPALSQALGAYVTYEKDGELRGCLGRLEGDRPAYLNVQYAAVAAAIADSRFAPVTPEELEALDLEITLLHPVRQVLDPDEIQIGREGVLLRVGDEGGALFLPQVALEEEWDLRTTLVNLCRKAGLPDDAWQRADARLYVFAGEWFREGE